MGLVPTASLPMSRKRGETWGTSFFAKHLGVGTGGATEADFYLLAVFFGIA